MLEESFAFAFTCKFIINNTLRTRQDRNYTVHIRVHTAHSKLNYRPFKHLSRLTYDNISNWKFVEDKYLH